MSLNLGATVQLDTGQTARIIELTDLFGQRYADVFIQPDGPVRRVLLADLLKGYDRDLARIKIILTGTEKD